MKNYLIPLLFALVFLVPVSAPAVVQQVQTEETVKAEKWEKFRLGKEVKKVFKKAFSKKNAPEDQPHILNVLSLLFSLASLLALLVMFVAAIILIASIFSGELIGLGIFLVTYILALLFAAGAFVLGMLGINKKGKGLGIAGMILGGLILLTMILGSLG